MTTEPAEPLSPDILGQPFQSRTTVLAQIGWIGHRAAHVYGLTDAPHDNREPDGYDPLYIQVGNYGVATAGPGSGTSEWSAWE